MRSKHPAFISSRGIALWNPAVAGFLPSTGIPVVYLVHRQVQSTYSVQETRVILTSSRTTLLVLWLFGGVISSNGELTASRGTSFPKSWILGSMAGREMCWEGTTKMPWVPLCASTGVGCFASTLSLKLDTPTQ